MLRCIQIAKNGLGTTAPNPMVGCVIVHENKIIGEGFTSPYGGNHAEVNAIDSVKDKSLLKNASLYVTLEPCSHHGKTPPCSDLITEYNIPRVFIGVKDINELVDGSGISQLKKSGCEVMTGILETECRVHHKRFFTFHDKKRPYIILKWAESVDGYIAPDSKSEKKPVWISNEYSRQISHKWRGEEQAILVGTNTVLEDNPTLTSRNYTGKQPTRIVLDKDLKLEHEMKVFNSDAETIIISSAKAVGAIENPDFRTFETIDWHKTGSIAQQICEKLYKRNINSVIIEGGLQTLQTFINENLWDEAKQFVGNSYLNFGTKAPTLNAKIVSKRNIFSDTLITYSNFN